MHYNVKIIDYPNGDIQLRYYTEPLYKSDDVGEEKEKKNKLDDKFFVASHEIEPFTNSWAKVVEDIDDIESYEKAKFFSDMRSLNRTKQAVYSYSRCEPWEWFLTFTISAEKKDRYDYIECSKAVRKWLDNQRQNFAPDLKYLIVPERHKDGAWHFHGLLCNTGNMVFTYSGKKDKKKNMIYNLENYKLGFTTATRVKDIHKVAMYVGKYITKDLCSLSAGKQRYYVSKNVQKPVTTIMMIDKEENLYEFIEKIGNSFGKECVHVSSKGSDKNYTKTKYFEFQ